MKGILRASGGLPLLFLVILAPNVDAANGWLEKLSGPGPFHGFEYPTVPIGCWQPEDGGKRWHYGCQESENGSVILSFTLSDYDSEENRLDYDPEFDAIDKTVNLKSYMFSLDLQLHEGLDVGIGAGINRFSGDAFDTFHKWSLDPLRVIVKPLGFMFPETGHHPIKFLNMQLSLHQLVQFKFRATYIPQGFEASEFGAVPGTFDVPAELLFGASITFGVVLWW